MLHLRGCRLPGTDSHTDIGCGASTGSYSQLPIEVHCLYPSAGDDILIFNLHEYPFCGGRIFQADRRHTSKARYAPPRGAVSVTIQQAPLDVSVCSVPIPPTPLVLGESLIDQTRALGQRQVHEGRGARDMGVQSCQSQMNSPRSAYRKTLLEGSNASPRNPRQNSKVDHQLPAERGR